MSYNSGKSRENHFALMRTGVIQEARYVYESEANMAPLEQLAQAQNVKPADLALRGLNRVYAITLFRELNKHLNPLSDQQEIDILLPLQYMDETSLASIEREPIYVRTDLQSDFDISLLENGPGTGRFDLEVRKGQSFDEDALTSRDVLHNTYNVVMSEVDLAQSSLNVKEIPKKEEPIITTSSKRLSVRTRSDRASNLKKGKREQKQSREDLDEVEFALEILGIDEVGEVAPDVLIKFWENRGRSHIAVIDLFLYIVSRKQEINEAPGAHYHQTVQDLLVYGAKQSDPLELRRALEDKSLEIMTSTLGLLRNHAKGYFESADSELDKLRLRYLAWLSSYPELVGIRKQAKQLFRGPADSHDDRTHVLQEIYKTVMKDISEEVNRHQKAVTNEAWSSFGEIEYYRDIPDELDAYNRKLNFYRTAWILGKFLFTSDNMDDHLRK